MTKKQLQQIVEDKNIQKEENQANKSVTNKQIINYYLKSLNLTPGIYDKRIDTIAKSGLDIILQHLKHAPTDVDIRINNKPFVLEISNVDTEIDIKLLTKEEYISRYGNERWNED